MEAGDVRQHAIVGFAPFGYVVDGMKVTDDAPGARELLNAIIERNDKAVPACLHLVGCELSDNGAGLIK